MTYQTYVPLIKRTSFYFYLPTNRMWSIFQISSSILNPQLIPFVTSSNDPLPDALIFSKDAAIDHISSTLLEINNSISHLERSLDDLKTNRRLMEQARTSLSLTTSPIRRLPSEVIAAIIEAAIYPKIRLADKVDRVQFSVLRCVCRRWTQAAFQTHELWRGLSVNLVAEGIGRYGAPIGNLISSWFKRAGHEAPLRLRLYSGRTAIADMLVNVLLGSQVPWQQLLLEDPSLCRALQAVDGEWALPGVKVLTTTGETITPFRRRFPNLKSLYINEAHSQPTHPLRFFHNTLRSLHLARVDDVVVTAMVSAIPGLEEVILDAITCNGAPPVMDPIVHHGIKKLVVVNQDPVILDAFTFPSLDLLQVIGEVVGYHRLAYIHRILLRSLCEPEIQGGSQCALSLERCGMERQIMNMMAEAPPTGLRRVHTTSFTRRLSMQEMFPCWVRSVVIKEPLQGLNNPNWLGSFLDHFTSNRRDERLHIYCVPLISGDLPPAADVRLTQLRQLGVYVHGCSSTAIGNMLAYSDIQAHQYHMYQEGTKDIDYYDM
ncbi:hypothetical protein FA15DRAFT_716902 [Coprinopsis marcescibilis]|uniref:Uncharacterized protein n=1 Tax=Coprinopsis marcescibilis TaxID=230819 RepID=A0A5C3KN64_COPMA|nr:hypothetical protein FA15DRAFT_716902 [Coprinopsis marcescibilis]